MEKTILAFKKTKIFSIALSGGVSSNTYIRKKFSKVSNKNRWELHLLPKDYTTDNAAMIAIAAQIKYSRALFDDLDLVTGSNCLWKL